MERMRAPVSPLSQACEPVFGSRGMAKLVVEESLMVRRGFLQEACKNLARSLQQLYLSSHVIGYRHV